MADFTLFELHFEDSDLTANAPYSYGEKDVDADGVPPAPTTAADTSSKRGPVLAVLVGLGFLLAVAYLARKRVLGGDGATEDGFDAGS
jgi:hypothetical protein